jgi:hypothetical protein
MAQTYKQSCKIDPTKIDFSAFEQKDIQRTQFSTDELYEAGIVRNNDTFHKITGYLLSKKLKSVRFGVVVAAIVLLVAQIFITVFEWSFLDWLTTLAALFFPIVIVLFGIYALGWIEEASQKIQLRWLLFAKKNGFKYHVGAYGSNSAGALAFNIGYGGNISNTLDLDDRLSVAEYTYKTKHGDEEVSHHLNFARFRLQNNLPHLVLDSKFSALQIKGPQEIRLEGDFQDHFTLYAPGDYHLDALQIFTPDVMSVLLDQEGKYDLELVGSDLYIYEMRQGLIESGLTVNALANAVKDRERHSRFINFLSSVIEIVGEIDEQTDHYRNTHVSK